MHIISNIALITINETLIIQLLSFLIFLYIINRIMFRPIVGVMTERNRYIETLKNDATDAGKKLLDITTQLEKQKISVKNEALILKNEQKQFGEKQAQKIYALAKKEIETLRDETAKEIDGQIMEARKHLKEEAEVLSVYVMEKVIERGLT